MHYLAKFQEPDSSAPPTFAITDEDGKKILDFKSRESISVFAKNGDIDAKLISPDPTPEEIIAKVREWFPRNIFAQQCISSAKYSEAFNERTGEQI